MTCKGFLKLGNKRRFWALKSWNSALSSLVMSATSLEESVGEQALSASDNGKLELSSRTAPGTAAWTGLEPGFTDLKMI